MKQWLLKQSKRVLDPLGLEIHRKTTRRNMSQALRQLTQNGVAPKTVVDVGVAKGTFALYEAFPDAFHFLVEPLQEFEEDLKQICQKYQGSYVISGAGQEEASLTMNVHEDLSSSSLFNEQEGKVADGTPRSIPITTLNVLQKQHQLDGPYVIKVDVQGAELDVIAGASDLLANTQAILLEVSFFEFYQGSPQFGDVVAAMQKHGFVVYDLFGGHNRPLDQALAQVDVVFVPENSPLRASHAYASPQQRQQMLETAQPQAPTYQTS